MSQWMRRLTSVFLMMISEDCSLESCRGRFMPKSGGTSWEQSSFASYEVHFFFQTLQGSFSQYISLLSCQLNSHSCELFYLRTIPQYLFVPDKLLMFSTRTKCFVSIGFMKFCGGNSHLLGGGLIMI